MNDINHKVSKAPTMFRAVMQNFGWMLASRGLAAVFSLIYLAIITRSLGVSGFGKFALITGAASLISSLLAFQTWQIIVQYGVNHIENGDDTKLARLFRGTALLDIGSAVVGIAFAAVILHYFADALGLKPTLARATLIFNIIILISMRSTPLGILRLRDRFNLAAAADGVTPTLRLIGAIIVGLVHPTLQAFLITWAIAELLTALAYWYFVHRIGDLKTIFHGGLNMFKVFEDNPRIVRFALTSNFSQTLFMSSKQLPLFLVGGLTGTAAAGAFRLAAQLSRALTTVSQMIARAAFPEIVRAIRNHGVSTLGSMLLRTIRVAIVVSLVVFALIVLFGQLLLETVGGEQFGIAYHSLLWLSAAACTELAIVGFEPSIMAAHRAHLAFLARLVATGIMVGGAFLLEPYMGADGVAAAVFANAIGQTLLMGTIIFRLIHRDRARPDKTLSA